MHQKGRLRLSAHASIRTHHPNPAASTAIAGASRMDEGDEQRGWRGAARAFVSDCERGWLALPARLFRPFTI